MRRRGVASRNVPHRFNLETSHTESDCEWLEPGDVSVWEPSHKRRRNGRLIVAAVLKDDLLDGVAMRRV